jgi:SAM-dependent methyltransferase
MNPHVVWHDVECGTYDADLPLWTALARAAGGPVLDVGAGTGRVALHLARAGHSVCALDRDPVLLAELARRADAAGLDVETVVADAAGFALPGGEHARFGLVAVPMQTIQLLPDRAARERFFAAARGALVPGGLVALALADMPEAFDDPGELPAPDRGERDGWRFVSQPVAVRLRPQAFSIERVRELIAPDGTRSADEDVVELVAMTGAALAAEAAVYGLRREPSRYVAPTGDHVGSEVVVLRG